MIHQYSSGAPGRHSSRSAAHPAPYPYPATRAATAHQRLASHPATYQQQHAGYATHQTASYLGQQQVELRQRVAAGTIGGGFALGGRGVGAGGEQQQQQQQQRLSFDRSTAGSAPVWPTGGHLTSSTGSSPFSEAASDDFGGAGAGDFGSVDVDLEGPAAAAAVVDDDDDDDESFEDGLIKEQYRARAWTTNGRRSSSNAGGYEPAPLAHYPVSVYQHSQQQQQQQQAGHLDRLFNGLQLPPLVDLQQHQHQHQQQAFYGHQQQQLHHYQPQQQQMLPPLQQQQQQQEFVPASPPVVPEPAQQAAPASALPLAPYVADSIWRLLLQQQAPAAAAVGGRKNQQQHVQINGGQFDDDRWFPAGTGYQTPPQLTVDDFALGPAGALAFGLRPPAPSANPYRLVGPSAPASFVRFVSQTLAQTLIGPAGVFLALWYVAFKMPLDPNGGGGEEGVHFRDELLNLGRRSASDGGGEAVARRVVTLGLAWANKWLDDNTFTNRSWSDVTHIPIEEINRLELSALATLKFDLSISDREWAAWLGHLYQSASSSATEGALIQTYLVELADALEQAESARAHAAEQVERRLAEAEYEREQARHERLLERQAWAYQQQRAAAAVAAAAAQHQHQHQQSFYAHPVSCARASAGPTYLHQHGRNAYAF